MTFVDGLLADRRTELGLVEHGIRGRLRTVLITPGYVTSRHIVGLVFEDGFPDPRLVVKVPRRPGDNGGVRREAAVLRELAERAGHPVAGVPAVLGCLDVGAYSLLVETAVTGVELAPEIVAADRDRAVRSGARFILGLPVTRTAAANAGWYDALITEPLAALARLAPLGGRTAELAQETSRVLEPLRQRDLPAVFEHADLSHPNLFLGADDALGVIDWERASSRGVPGHDLVFLLQHLGESAAAAFTRPAQLRAFDAAFGEPDGWALPVLIEHLRARALDPALAPLLVVATWARSAATLVARLVPDEESAVDAAPRPTPDQAAEAVHQDRDFLLWQHALAGATGAAAPDRRPPP